MFLYSSKMWELGVWIKNVGKYFLWAQPKNTRGAKNVVISFMWYLFNYTKKKVGCVIITIDLKKEKKECSVIQNYVVCKNYLLRQVSLRWQLELHNIYFLRQRHLFEACWFTHKLYKKFCATPYVTITVTTYTVGVKSMSQHSDFVFEELYTFYLARREKPWTVRD